MGYILPITPFQSMQYANIQRISSEHYANVAALQKISDQSQFGKGLSRRLERYSELEKAQDNDRHSKKNALLASTGKRKQSPVFSSLNAVKNQAQLSKEIAEITGKGINADYTI